jgi:hypothetical protein
MDTLFSLDQNDTALGLLTQICGIRELLQDRLKFQGDYSNLSGNHDLNVLICLNKR